MTEITNMDVKAWRIATPFVTKWLADRPRVRVAQLGYHHPALGWVEWADVTPTARAFRVGVHCDLDGSTVNAYGSGSIFGPDLLPTGERAMGLFVPNGQHPMSPGWVDDFRDSP